MGIALPHTSLATTIRPQAKILAAKQTNGGITRDLVTPRTFPLFVIPQEILQALRDPVQFVDARVFEHRDPRIHLDPLFEPTDGGGLDRLSRVE